MIDGDQQQCDRDDPHTAHGWADEGKAYWWCKGRMAHANVMIGKGE